MTIIWHITIKGRVQGVGFRAFCQKQAQNLALKGWVKNCDNGDVELCACGDEQNIALLEQKVRQGPPLSRVDKIIEHQKRTATTCDYVDFRITY